MEGTPQIDILMIPVMKAIKKHVKDRDAQTEIYNRAYEAIQISMDVTPKEANSLLRSAYSIASRNGEQTNWDAFKSAVYKELVEEQELRTAQKRIVDLEDQVDVLEDGLNKIKNWSIAYPLEMFPEPDWKKARELLQAGGISIDEVSAHCMRHVVEGIGRIAREALEVKG